MAYGNRLPAPRRRQVNKINSATQAADDSATGHLTPTSATESTAQVSGARGLWRCKGYREAVPVILICSYLISERHDGMAIP